MSGQSIDGPIELKAGNTIYTWNSGQNANTERGYFNVTIERTDATGAVVKTDAKLTTAEMLLVIYDWLQTGQTGKVEQTAKAASLISEISLAASDLVKVMGLFNTAFDGTYFKHVSRPEGAIASVQDRDYTKGIKYDFVGGYMGIEDMKSMISAYGKMMNAFEQLNTPEMQKILSGMNLSLSELKSSLFPLGSWDLVQDNTVTLPDKYLYMQPSLMASDTDDDRDASRKALHAFWDQWNNNLPSGAILHVCKGATDPSGTAGPNNTNGDTWGDDWEAVGANAWSGKFSDGDEDIHYNPVISFKAAGTYALQGPATEWDDDGNAIAWDDSGAIDWDNEDNLTILAFAFLYPQSGDSRHSGNYFTATSSADAKETFNNLMNKYNAATQTATQYASQELSTSESRQTMIDSNISSLTDTMVSIARGY